MNGDVGSSREEAERLVAAGLGVVSTALHGGAATAFSTGSADCCVCPVCRVIAALRDPSPELAEQLASSVGDLAVGLAGLLRAFSVALSTPYHDSKPNGDSKAVKKAAPRDTEPRDTGE